MKCLFLPLPDVPRIATTLPGGIKAFILRIIVTVELIRLVSETFPMTRSMVDPGNVTRKFLISINAGSKFGLALKISKTRHSLMFNY